MAIEPVRHARLLLRRRPRGDDAQIAIDLHGIGVDDDAAGFCGKLERQGRLAAGGRPCDKHGLVSTPSEFACMSLVATLICNPANPALDSTIVDGALAVLPSLGSAQWLFDEVAVDIPFDRQRRHQAIENRLRAGARRPADRHGRAACARQAQEASSRRHGFHHDRPGMHRRTGRFVGLKAQSQPSPSAR